MDTDALRYLPEAAEMVRETAAFTPLGRIATPADVAAVVGLLILPQSYWINGQVIIADGGFSAR